MSRILAALPLVLIPLAAYASIAPEPPAEANLLGTLVFLALFLGSCVAVGWMIWRNEKKSKQKVGQQ
jgi:nicotinamide riboside transporter PnuC